MVEPERLEATGRTNEFGGLRFEQMQIKGGYGAGSRFIHRLVDNPTVTVKRVANFYRVTIDGEALPTKFREWHTAAKAIEKALRNADTPTV